MNRGIQVHPADWDQQQEQLSAYLDGELSLAERQTLEHHLPTCARCQEALAQLRAVRRLLNAMPTPALPRSFALPTAGSVPAPVPLRARAAARRAPQVPPVAARIAQQVGALAAAVGLVLLLGSTLLGQGLPKGLATSAGQAAPAGSKSTEQRSSTPLLGGIGSTPGATVTATPGGGVTGDSHTPTPPVQRQAPEAVSSRTHSSSSAVPVLPLAGSGLLVGGAILFLGGRITGRRRGGRRER
jgi:anti-sigma factor RsiW